MADVVSQTEVILKERWVPNPEGLIRLWLWEDRDRPQKEPMQ